MDEIKINTAFLIESSTSNKYNLDEEKDYSIVSIKKNNNNKFSSDLQRLASPAFSIIYPKQDCTLDIGFVKLFICL